MNSRIGLDKTLLDWVGASQLNELSLLQKYLNSGDLRNLLALYKPYMHLVYGLAFKYVQDPKQSQEIVYCLFKKLIKEVRHQEIRLFSAWLYLVCLNFCKQWRERGRYEADQISATSSSGQTPITFYEDGDQDFEEEINSVENEVKKLKEQQEECARLFFDQQKCFQEIAVITGWKISEIRRHLRNVKKRTNIYQD